jgi:hypothetical protein
VFFKVIRLASPALATGETRLQSVILV